MAMFVSVSLTAMGTMSTQVLYAAILARTRLLPQAVFESVDQQQPGSGLMSMVHITIGAVVPMCVEI